MKKSKEAEIVVLLGSQKGKTEVFAKLLVEALTKAKQKVAFHELNEYGAFPKMKLLIVITSTYGKGVPPANAKNFLSLLQQIKNPKNVNFSVVGFGSKKYPKFCQFAKDVNEALENHSNFKNILEPVYINNSCYSTFLNWSRQWSTQTSIPLNVPELNKAPKIKSYRFKVKKQYKLNKAHNDTIFIELSTKKHKKIKKGDYLAIRSKHSQLAHYPIEKLKNKNVLIAFNKADLPITSQLKKKKKFKAKHICNTHFQLLGEGMNIGLNKHPKPSTLGYSKLLKKIV